MAIITAMVNMANIMAMVNVMVMAMVMATDKKIRNPASLVDLAQIRKVSNYDLS